VLTVPIWAWAAFLAFVIAMLALDVFVLHRGTHEVSLREASVWSAVWIIIGLGFGGLVWAWAGVGTAQAYLAGYLIEKSLSVDNLFLFAAIFSAFAIPARYQHRVLMFGIIGALLMRAAFIAAGISLLEAVHPVSYVFGAVLFVAAFNMLRGGPTRRRGTRGRCSGCGAGCRSPTGSTAGGSCCATAAACWPPRCCSRWWSSRPPTSSSPSTRSRRSSR
jgi:tellurite resistance protein TerC